MPGGRPTSLTPELQRVICNALRKGNYRAVACEAAGISYQTFLNWLKEGQRPDGKPEFVAFFEAVKKAEAYAERKLVRMWQKEMPSNWQAIATFLERRYPDRWSKRDQVTVDLRVKRELEEALDKLAHNLSLQEYERVLGVLADDNGCEGTSSGPTGSTPDAEE